MTADCPTCGPLPGPMVHDTCHAIPGLSTWGCGHALRDHSDGMRCRICDVDCAGGPRVAGQREQQANEGRRHAVQRLFD